MMDEQFMREALVQAQKAQELGEIPIGAVLVKDGKILCATHNLCEQLHDATAHAERLAISEAGKLTGSWRLSDCTLYVTVEPCVMCAGALGWAQTKRVVFGAADEKRGFQRFAPQALHPKTEVASGVMADECAALMKAFFSSRR